LGQATRWYVRHDINPKLMNDVMGSIRIPIPPIEEQESIAQTLGQERKTASQVGETISRQVELLREHRQAIITAAVTGALEIPGVAG
jgi:type I restriction enzyme S subunit